MGVGTGPGALQTGTRALIPSVPRASGRWERLEQRGGGQGESGIYGPVSPTAKSPESWRERNWAENDLNEILPQN